MTITVRTLVIALFVALHLPADATAQVRVPGPRAEVDLRRGWIGITFGAPEPGAAGVVVQEVLRQGPAAVAGIRPGDRITSWNDRTDVASAIRSTPLEPGDTVRLRVVRNGSGERELTLVAEGRPQALAGAWPRIEPPMFRQRPGDDRRFLLRDDTLLMQMDSMQARLRTLLRDSLGPELESARLQMLRAQQELAEMRRRVLPEARREMLRADSLRRAAGDPLASARLQMERLDSLRRAGDPPLGIALAGPRNAVAGAEVTDLTPGLADYFGTAGGVLVLRVAPGTPAEQAGMQEGDVIVRAAGREVDGVIELRRVMADSRGADGLELDVVRRGSPLTINLSR